MFKSFKKAHVTEAQWGGGRGSKTEEGRGGDKYQAIFKPLERRCLLSYTIGNYRKVWNEEITLKSRDRETKGIRGAASKPPTELLG